MLIFLFILSLLVNGALGYACYNTITKLNICEDYILALRGTVNHVLKTMRAIDERGAFERDDEVGAAFYGMKELTDSLEGFVEANSQ